MKILNGKIEIVDNLFIINKMEVHLSQLVEHTKYIILSQKIYKGTYIQTMWDHYIVFNNLNDQHNKYNSLMFYGNEKYYDIDHIKKLATQARQSMEQRALNKILARLINDNFKW